jgi:hypothetical protein
MLEFLAQPWPWYITGPLIGLIVPALLILGNKHFGISSSMRHICAAAFSSNIPFFKYDWKKEMWNLFFVSGVLVGGMIAAGFFSNPEPIRLNEKLVIEMQSYNINDTTHLLPSDIFTFENLFTLRGFILIAAGGFFVGFGTRYAGGCTSGHSIMGIANLQLSSLIATICFMIGGIIVANYVIPIILRL